MIWRSRQYVNFPWPAFSTPVWTSYRSRVSKHTGQVSRVPTSLCWVSDQSAQTATVSKSTLLSFISVQYENNIRERIYLIPRQSEENYARNFITCTLHILLGWPIYLFIFQLKTLLRSPVIQRRVDEWLVSNKLRGIWIKMAMTYSDVLFQNLFGGPEGNLVWSNKTDDCIKHEKWEMNTNVWSENLKRRDNLEYVDIWDDNIKMDLEIKCVRMWTEFIWLRIWISDVSL
jgi:hypothetical protein